MRAGILLLPFVLVLLAERGPSAVAASTRPVSLLEQRNQQRCEADNQRHAAGRARDETRRLDTALTGQQARAGE
jgi:hypothetical protein